MPEDKNLFDSIYDSLPAEAKARFSVDEFNFICAAVNDHIRLLEKQYGALFEDSLIDEEQHAERVKQMLADEVVNQLNGKYDVAKTRRPSRTPKRKCKVKIPYIIDRGTDLDFVEFSLDEHNDFANEGIGDCICNTPGSDTKKSNAIVEKLKRLCFPSNANIVKNNN